MRIMCIYCKYEFLFPNFQMSLGSKNVSETEKGQTAPTWDLVVTLIITVFWDVTSCCLLYVYRCFECLSWWYRQDVLPKHLPDHTASHPRTQYSLWSNVLYDSQNDEEMDGQTTDLHILHLDGTETVYTYTWVSCGLRLVIFAGEGGNGLRKSKGKRNMKEALKKETH
jgi:hypothetical protein